TRQNLLGNESAVSFLLALFSVGIAIGSLAYDKLSHHRVELGSVPISGALITLWGYLFATQIPPQLPVLFEFSDFISYQPLWPTFAYLFLLGVSGGLFIVPLYVLLQQRSQANERAQVIAAMNIYNALFMVGSAILGIVALSLVGLSIPQLFAILAIMNGIIALWLFFQYPVHVVRLLISLSCRLLYRVKTRHIDNIPESGGALIVCNHVSYLDALLLSAASPRLIRFVMEEDYANFPLIRHFLRRAGVIPINAARSQSIRRAFQAVEQALSEGELVCIFPEGRLTSDGEIHSFMRGTDIILQRSTAPVIPVAIRGLWGTYFSRHLGRACKGLPTRWWSKVEVVVGTPIPSGQANNKILHEQVSLLRGLKR
ncbi:MAG: 1-acyl-sn-glycerol-3-phosphate acyltransferase, partial [Vibrio sp.]